LIPVHGMNRDQCSAESHVPRWGGIGPDLCHKPGSILRNKPGPATKRNEPGPMPVIGPDLRAEPGQMAFGCWTKDPFSTSASADASFGVVIGLDPLAWSEHIEITVYVSFDYVMCWLCSRPRE
jgi:hypothetical protein